MRLLLYCVVLVLALCGPVLYFTRGASARAERSRRLESLAAERDRTRSLLLESTPPDAAALDAAEAAIRAREQDLARFKDALAAASRAPAPDAGALRAAATGVLDPVVTDALLATMAGGSADEIDRRRALGALLHAAGGSGDVRIEKVNVGALPAVQDEALGLRFARIETTALGPIDACVRFVEALLAGSADDPPADLLELRLERTTPETWTAVDTQTPPTRARVAARVVVGAVETP